MKHDKNEEKSISKRTKMMKGTVRIGTITKAAIAGMFLVSVLLGSCNNNANISPGMKIGSEGVDFAKKIAAQFPYRKAYSQQEKGVASLIETELKDMNYTPEVITFGTDKSISQNIIVKIPGNGFQTEVSKVDSSVDSTIRKQVIIGAHYDSFIGIEQKATFPDYDGIQENASGVGALISIAKELKGSNNGYDVILVFFGAGNDNFAGANNYFTSMTKDEIANTDAMYCIESIYAGDKLYAHAGINSTVKGTKYEKRRKLYEISDVAIANAIDLRFNESDLDIDVNNDKVKEVYREISTTKSDYSVFDNANIPCVFLESYDYYGETQAIQQESKNPSFGTTKGKIRGTNFDSMLKLSAVLEKDRLETRIKNTAFLVVKAIEKGIYKTSTSTSKAAGTTTPTSKTASKSAAASISSSKTSK